MKVEGNDRQCGESSAQGDRDGIYEKDYRRSPLIS